MSTSTSGILPRSPTDRSCCALTRASFSALFDRHLKPGGIYAIEDWETGYWPRWPDGKAYEPGHAHGMVGFIKDLVDEVGAHGITHPEHGTPPERVPRVTHLEIHPGLVIAIKPDWRLSITVD